ncbi:MAG TPA: pitrilysin family protein [Candidatus Omnitrophota bacterium]|nr:pitrilysin family protein [Candidatus Omnitrophota bacterium]HPD85658.1 pitrilysin family protein [Candidatus Omnitrophota bacterium]HRZ04501.1 pitrilysin family protein [Candidatus Omnitrophota bacterium]
MKSIRIVLVAGIFLLAAHARMVAAETVTSKHILDNGMTVLISEMPSTPVVAVQALVKSGSANEGQYLGCGITHFIEHMLFKGTQKRGPGQISKEVKSLGGIINASTSFDYTYFTIELPRESWGRAVDILSDMLMDAAFDPQEVQRERDVILSEIRLYNDRPEHRLSQMVFSNVFIRHPYRHPIIGYEPLFHSITRDDLLTYYRETYVPNNIIFTVAGNVKTREVLDRIKVAFKDSKPRPYPLRNLPSEPAQLTMRQREQEYTTNLTRLSMAFQGVSVASEDMFALDVLSMIFGQGESSRLYREVLKKESLVYAISSGNFTPMDQGLFEISCVLDEKNVIRALAAIKEQIALIQEDGVSVRELKKAKRQVLSRYLSGRQTAAAIAEDAAINEAFIGDVDFSKKYVSAVSALTADDIKKVASKYLTDHHLTVAILRPKAQDAVGAQEINPVAAPEIQKIILDNGMTVLLKEDHAFPLISVRLSLLGGLRQEPEGKNGISNLMADLWTKGTASKNSEQIAESIEARGMGLGGFSGQNSFGLSADFLSEDIEFCFLILEDLIKNPTFPQEELLKSKEQAKSAIVARDDNILAVASRNIKETLFLKHPYRNDPLGTLSSVDAISREDIINFYRTLGIPNNMVLSVFGDFNSQEVLKTVKAKFSALSKKEIMLNSPSEAPVEATREKEVRLPKKQAVVAMGFQGPKLSDPDIYAIEILSSILNSPLSGRLFTKIRDELGQAYTLGGSFTPGIDVGFIYFYVSTTDEQVEKVKNVLLGQIEELRNNPVNDEELGNTKTYLKGTHKMGLETNASRATVSTLDELYGLGFDRYKLYDQQIDGVTKEDVQRLARLYLDMNKAAIVILRPQAEGETLSTPGK